MIILLIILNSTLFFLCFVIHYINGENKHLNNLLNNALNEIETLRSENNYLKEHIKQANKGVNYARYK